MSDEGKLNEQAARGMRARHILDDPLVKAAFDHIQETIDTAWKTSAGDDARSRENAYIMHRLLQNFRRQFELHVLTGDAAQKELLKLSEKSKLRRFVNV